MSTLSRSFLRICLHAQVAGGLEEVVHCAGQVECGDFVSVAGKDAVDGQVADAKREDPGRIPGNPMRHG